MKIGDILSFALGAIKLRKLRAALTTLGVIIGIAAIVALLSLGQGFQHAITAQFQRGFATNTLIVSTATSGLGTTGLGATRSGFSLLVNDTETIDWIGGVVSSAAIVQKGCYVKFGERVFKLNVVGVDFAKYVGIYGSTFVAESGGVPLNPEGDAVVVGKRISDPFGNGTILVNVGDKVEIIWTTRSGYALENRSYTGTVVAVLREVGGFGLSGPSDTGIYVPVSQAQSFFETH